MNCKGRANVLKFLTRITLQMAAIIWCPYLLFSRCVISLSQNSLRSRLMPSRRFLTTSPSWSAWGQVWASTSMTNNSRAEPISTAASPCYNPALLPCVSSFGLLLCIWITNSVIWLAFTQFIDQKTNKKTVKRY